MQYSTSLLEGVFCFLFCSVREEIGSGQFGTVSKGVWMYQNESMEVAVKALAITATETNRVKFLQEAAIMGQFYHPNIVRLHGVVTVGDPVMLRDYVIKSNTLLSVLFCRY